MKRKITIYLGLILSLGFIILIIKIVNFQDVIKALEKFNFNYLAILLALYLYGMVIRTIRWRLLIKQSKDVSFWKVFSPLSIGFMVNNVLPAKIGEIVRAEYIARENRISRGFSLGTVFAERMFDTILVLIFLFGSIFFSKTLLNIIQANIWLLVILVLIIALVLLILLSRAVQQHLTSFLPKKYQGFMSGLMERTSKSVSFLRQKHLFFKISFLTVLIWLGIVLGYVLIFKAFGLKIPVYGYFAIVSLGSIGMVIPSTSANIGVYDVIVMSAIMLFMVNKDTAFAIAAVAHALDIVPNILLGLIILVKDNLSLIAIGKKYIGFNNKG